MYVSPNFKTKKQLKEAFVAGKEIRVFSPGQFMPKRDGEETVEGPHFPQPHSWYARVEVKDGKVVAIKS